MSHAKEVYGFTGMVFVMLGAAVLVVLGTAWALGFFGATMPAWFWLTCGMGLIVLSVGVVLLVSSLRRRLPKSIHIVASSA
jgi:Kef-type K+ transport system membrane component KefB